MNILGELKAERRMTVEVDGHNHHVYIIKNANMGLDLGISSQQTIAEIRITRSMRPSARLYLQTRLVFQGVEFNICSFPTYTQYLIARNEEVRRKHVKKSTRMLDYPSRNHFRITLYHTSLIQYVDQRGNRYVNGIYSI